MRNLIALVLLTGCVTGPKTEKKNALEVLNGENYQVNATGGAGPVYVPLNLERRVRVTRIAGHVRLAGDAFAPYPPRVEVALLDGQDRELERTMTDSDGAFQFARTLPNGRYRLRTTTPQFDGDLPFDVSAYEVKDLVLSVRRH